MPNYQHYTTALSFPGTTPPQVCKRCLGSSPTKRHTAHWKCAKFGPGIWSKQWHLGYDELLSNFSVPNFQSHQLHHKLCTISRLYI